MPANEYYFVSHWRVPCTPQEAYDILSDQANLANWWPAGFLEADPITFEDGTTGVKVATKGWLPYILRFSLRPLLSDPPGSLTVEAKGDLNGRGIWTLMQDGDWTNITYDWRVSADKAIVRLLSPFLKPLFKSGHDWIMDKGEQSLRLELARRRATSDPVRNAIEPPPGPASIPLAPIAAVIGLFVLWQLRPGKKKPQTKREQAVALVAATAATLGSQTKQARKDAEKTARKAQKELRRRGSKAYNRLEDTIDRAREQSGNARGRATSVWDHTDLDERVGAARERLEAAIERANVPERVEAVRERVARAIDESDVPERLEAAKERVERALDRSDVPERVKATRRKAGRKTKSVFGRWHL